MIARYSTCTQRAPMVAPLLGFAATTLLSVGAFVAVTLTPEAEPAPPRAANTISKSGPDKPARQHARAGEVVYTDGAMDVNGIPIAPWFYWEGRDARLGYGHD